MNENKSYFQRVSSIMENTLYTYKSLEPNTFGSLVRIFFPKFLIILSVVLVFYGVCSYNFEVFFASPAFFLFGIILYFVDRKNIKFNFNGVILNKLENLKSQINVFNTYPDVKNYFTKFDSQVQEITKRKKRLQQQFKIFKYSVYAVLLGVVIYSVSLINFSEKLRNEKDLRQFYRILNLKADEPFLKLKPIKTSISENKQIESPEIELFIKGNTCHFLIIKELKIKNAQPTDIFRVMITDKDAKPVHSMLKFTFKGDQTQKIWIVNPVYYDRQSDYTICFHELKVYKYLKEHEKDLYFIVEKL
ncbi:MAG: hypothetical protein IJ150_12260 [Bacteroidales bacterium]|nr:hypothetical protein [Bacteroidales bacterium]